MNTKERKRIIEQLGFKIKNNEILDETTNEILQQNEQDKIFIKKYIGENSEIHIKGPNQLTIKRKNITFTIKEFYGEQIITLQDKTSTIEITSTLEGMMYKIGSIKIKETTNKKSKTSKYIQRIEQAEIDGIILVLEECNPELIANILIKNITIKPIIKPIIKDNIIKILNHLKENKTKYLEGLEPEKDKHRIKILKQYQGL